MKNYILQNENGVYFECGYSCDNVIFLVFGSERFFITDARYEIEAKNLAQDCEVVITNQLLNAAKELIKKHKIKNLHFDPSDFSVHSFETLSKDIKTNFVQELNFSKNKRIIKTPQEIKYIKKAMKLGREGFKRFGKFINENGLYKSEKYLYFKAKEAMSNMGELDLSFDPIVAINQNSAKPHALPTSDVLHSGDLLLVDAGIKYKRYCSDRTCTSFVGDEFNFKRKQFFSKQEQQKVYDIVLKAQQKAIEKAKVGMKAKDIDKIARDVIDKAGYGKYFVHSTGHGVGLDIHEYPVINSKSETIIEENMVFTIEPGIYLAQNFGVRIEDTIAMIDGRGEIL
ncbi:MAG: M24 family metallopeptidase [Campylobacterales bacterium]|nr:M24 family metallopeptidase [Campylobacterales bacterium]